MIPQGLDTYALKIEVVLHGQIQKALIQLLETKRLYQSVEIDLLPVEKEIRSAVALRKQPPVAPMSTVGGSHVSKAVWERAQREPYDKALALFRSRQWQFDTEYYPLRIPGHNQGAGPVYFRTPTIKIPCRFCDSIEPAHNSGYPGLKDQVTSIPMGMGQGGYCQTLVFPFLCQSCKKVPVAFSVTRRANKLTLSGSSEFPSVTVPKEIPTEEAEFFSKALISHSAGHTLAGILYLRVVVEQHMRRIARKKGKATGDELWKLYRTHLNADFPKSFKTLGTAYEELSEKIHNADASVDQFENSRQDIERHFQALKLLPLVDDPPPKE